jgi:C4-dicarboxylate-specific signal transduction histidine kinase
MAIIDTQQTGIDGIGDMVSWATHFCLFYETKDDLLSALISYCKAGLERDEYCLWIVAEPLTIEQAREALQDAVPDVDRHLADSRMELVAARDMFLQGGTFDEKRVAAAMYEKLGNVSARGYPGVRVTGDTSWLTKKDWTHYCKLEDAINEVIGNQRLSVLCTFPLAACGPFEILDTVRAHQFALARRYGGWEVIESAALKKAKAEIAKLNEELEHRVAERTSQLMQTSDALREAQTELAHANRVATMGQLAGSIAHEIKQPIGAAIVNAQAASRWLRTQPPNLVEAQASLSRIVKAGNRANDFIDGIRNIFKKAPPRKVPFDINEAILEVIALTRGEWTKRNVSVATQLAEGLPHIEGNRVELEQVILNLVINAIEAMSGVSEGARHLLIRTENDASGGMLVVVQDSGPGVSSKSFGRLFDAFYTTKPGGMGMGLSICKSLVEAHNGRLRAVPHGGPGAIFEIALPIHGKED